jgi:hypothetical protein
MAGGTGSIRFAWWVCSRAAEDIGTPSAGHKYDTKKYILNIFRYIQIQYAVEGANKI